VLLAASLGLTAVVTAVLNLDTAVVFLTPVLIQTARARGLSERTFVYGTVFMSNSASLLLVGSNLTNLLVVDGARLSGLDFARTMLAPWVAAVMVTWLVFSIIQRRQPCAASSGRSVASHLDHRAGAAAIAAAAALVIALPDPSVAVLVLGVVVAAWQRLRGGVDTASVLRTTPPALVGIFVVAVCVGTLARLWLAPAILVTTAARPAAVVLGALGAVAINNLPAASLLSSQPLAHPFFLILGLNLGPNLAITGSLSAILWLRLARQNGAEASIWRYSRLGLVIAPLQLAGAAATLALLHPAA
jgi:arsenical pump membrane protein